MKNKNTQFTIGSFLPNSMLLSLLITLAFAGAFASCNAIADTSGLNLTPETVWISLTPTAPVFDDNGVGTAKLVLDLSKEIAGLTDNLNADALANIFSFYYKYPSEATPRITAAAVKKSEPAIYTLTVSNVPYDEEGFALVTISAPGVTPPTRPWALNGSIIPDPMLLSFTFEAGRNALPADAIGVIDERAKTVSVIVPDGTERNGLIPHITHNGKTITPENERAQDFTNAVIYTVKALGGAEAVYRVRVFTKWTHFTYNETAYRPRRGSMNPGNSATLLADTTMPSATYDSEGDIIVSMGDFPAWAADGMTADDRLALFCDVGPVGSFTIDGKEYPAMFIYSIAWGSDVEGAGTRSLDNNFMSNFYGLASLDLYPLSNFSTIGQGFLLSCSSLTALDLTPLSSTTTFGTGFLFSCTLMASVNMGSISYLNIESEGSFSLFNSALCTVTVQGTPQNWTDRFTEVNGDLVFANTQ
ncbi:MAG: DUF5018 domain-containing protein [Spirochaetaceae bacterium]|jgi:hypothetical protein|nr:DUF5018 domain-containing protein [Spirochaetaceae bacterium]